MVPHVRRLFRRRTDALLIGSFANVVLLVAIGMTGSFWLALLLLVVWAMAFAVELPLRQAFLNGVIPSEQRATVLSFDNLMASAGGVVIQPGLGRVADVYGYPASYVASAAITALAIPFVVLARRENAPSDPITVAEPGSATSIT
jgi:MFS family permease